MSRRPPPNLGDVGCGGGGRITRTKSFGFTKAKVRGGCFYRERKKRHNFMWHTRNDDWKQFAAAVRFLLGTPVCTRDSWILSFLWYPVSTSLLQVGYLESKKLCWSFLRSPRVECRSRDCPSHCNRKSVLRANLHPNKEGEHDPNWL